MILSMLKYIPIAIIVILAIVIIASGYVKAPPDSAFIISGLRKKPRVLIGRAGVKVPFFERLDKLLLKQMSVDIKTNGYIPTRDFIGVDIDAVAKVRVLTDNDISAEKGITSEMVEAARRNFLNMNEDQIKNSLTDSLQGNMREIIGTQELKNLCNDRKTFGDEVQAKAQKDMNALGIFIESCNIQKITDENELIIALGQDNMAQISKNAAIAKSNADREVAIAKAENEKQANDAKVAAAAEIAAKQNELEMKKAALKTDADTALAKAAAAKAIEDEKQRQLRDVAATEADIARQEKAIQLKEREVTIKERALEAEVKKTAEAEKYAAQQRADAELYEIQKNAEAAQFKQERQAEAALVQAQKNAEAALVQAQKNAEAELVRAQREAEAQKAIAEADKYAKEQNAEAVKAAGLAEAAAIQARGEAEAAAIRAKAEAEAEGLLKKAEAMKQYGDAAKQQMELDTIKVLYEQLPAIAQAIGAGYANADIKLIGNDSGQLAGNIMSNITQIIEGFKGSTGIDPTSVISGMIGAKMAED